MKKYKVICKQGKIEKSKIVSCNSYSSLIEHMMCVFAYGKFNFKEIHIDFNRKMPLVFIELWG